VLLGMDDEEEEEDLGGAGGGSSMFSASISQQVAALALDPQGVTFPPEEAKKLAKVRLTLPLFLSLSLIPISIST